MTELCCCGCCKRRQPLRSMAFTLLASRSDLSLAAVESGLAASEEKASRVAGKGRVN